jgi:hypothetical protein
VSVYSDIENALDEEEERILRSYAKRQAAAEDEEPDFDEWWERLDDIEREEYNRWQSE